MIDILNRTQGFGLQLLIKQISLQDPDHSYTRSVGRSRRVVERNEDKQKITFKDTGVKLYIEQVIILIKIQKFRVTLYYLLRCPDHYLTKL